MKKIVPFKKDIIFKTNLSEITSISLENTLKVEDNVVSGNFIVSGEYKVTDNSIDALKFLYELPFEVAFDPKYDLNETVIDIDDFYYEIVNSSILSINIEVLIDNIKEKLIEEDNMDSVREIEEKRCIEEEDIEDDTVENIKEENNSIDISLFNTLNIEDTYNTYKVYIVRENDTIENIIEKYGVTKDELDAYNDLSELKIGNKIIIPVTNEGN